MKFRSLRCFLALAMFGVVVAGCGSGDPGTNATVTEGGSGTSGARAAAVRFSGCMRSHGVSAFPDPGPSGKLTIDGVVNGSSLDPNSPAFQQALAACRRLEPPGFTGGKVTAQQRTVRLEFAQCMREHGVADFPDPTPNGPLVDTNRIPSAATPTGMSSLNAAMRVCGAIYSGRLGVTHQ